MYNRTNENSICVFCFSEGNKIRKRSIDRVIKLLAETHTHCSAQYGRFNTPNIIKVIVFPLPSNSNKQKWTNEENKRNFKSKSRQMKRFVSTAHAFQWQRAKHANLYEFIDKIKAFIWCYCCYFSACCDGSQFDNPIFFGRKSTENCRRQFIAEFVMDFRRQFICEYHKKRPHKGKMVSLAILWVFFVGWLWCELGSGRWIRCKIE